ncbi:953_t:CDS:2, partial [Acaulospora colombiana]
SECGLGSVHLMGVLQGHVSGELQLKDRTGQILAINISSTQQIQTYHLRNVWVIPEYDIVIEKPGKFYIRFAIEKDTRACTLQVQLKSHVAELNPRSEAAYFHLSGDFLRFLPVIYVGSTYELACSSELVQSEDTGFWLKNIDTAEIRCIQVGSSKDPIHTRYRDLLGREFGPTILQLDGIQKDLNVEEVLNVSDVLYGEFTMDQNCFKRCGSIVSFQGYLVSKEFRVAATLPKFIGQTLRGEISGQRDTNLLLRIRDLRTKDVIDVYVTSTTKYVIPLGLIPGQPLVLRQVVVKTSEIGNVYCSSLPMTHISLAGFPKDKCAILQELENTKLIDLCGKSTRTIYRIHCTITRIIHLSIQLVCEICEQVYCDNSCPSGCILFPPKFRVEGKFEVKDGTSKATAVVKDEQLLRELLRLNDDQYQKIFRAATQKKIYHCYDKNNLLNQVSTCSSIGEEIILYCRPISQQTLGRNALPIRIELGVIDVEEVQPDKETLKYLQSLKNL